MSFSDCRSATADLGHRTKGGVAQSDVAPAQPQLSAARQLETNLDKKAGGAGGGAQGPA